MSTNERAQARFRAPQREVSGAWAARRRLAAAMREVIDHLVTSEAPEDELTRAADALERFAERLRAHPRRGAWDQLFRESSVSGDVGEFFDQSPLLGRSNPIAPPIELWVEGDRVLGRARYGAAYEGPPGHVHGGMIAAAFDELLGYTQSLTEHPGMTGRLVVHYRRPTPLYTDLEFEGSVLRVEGRKIFTSGTLRAEGRLLAESEGLFIRVDPGKMAALAAQIARRVDVHRSREVREGDG
ncbi:MAG: PaaI family thioesterase [Myxococcota bacterium]